MSEFEDKLIKAGVYEKNKLISEQKHELTFLRKKLEEARELIRERIRLYDDMNTIPDFERDYKLWLERASQFLGEILEGKEE